MSALSSLSHFPKTYSYWSSQEALVNTKPIHKFLSRVLLAGAITLAIVVSSPVLGQQTAVDPTFNAVPSVPLTTGANLQQLLQPDGKVLVFGPKVVVNGVAKTDV